jgi:Phage protein (N4 Gp49/phage Sf6 gene 66) family
MTSTGSLEASDEAAAAVQKSDNRVTLASLRQKITNQMTINPSFAPHMTIAVLLVDNGFVLIGKSAPADPKNYNPELGVNFAIDDALRHLWELEGYALVEKLYQRQLDDGTDEAA